MGRILVIANQKGGVGKTTTAVNLAACMATAGRQVLLVDLDPQGNATSGLGLDKNDIDATLYDLFLGELGLEDVVLETDVKNLHIITSNKDLVGAEVELVDVEKREFRLRDALEPIRNEYDFILIDCPPALSLLTINGFCAADGVLITLQCEYYALEGLSELLNTIILVRDNLNSQLELEGVVLTMYQHTNLSKQVVADVRSHLGTKVYKTIIPRNVTLSEAPSFGLPVIFYDATSAGARAYQILTKEVLKRCAMPARKTEVA